MTKVTPQSNVRITVADGKMTLVIDLENVEKRPSKSGKSMLLATTGGAEKVRLGDGRTVNVNCTIYELN